MKFERVEILLDFQSSLLNALKKHLGEFVNGLNASKCVHAREAGQGILECITPWNGFTLVPEVLLYLKKRVFKITKRGLFSEPEPIIPLSFEIEFPLDISTNDKYAILMVKEGTYKSLYDLNADVFVGNIYTWQVDKKTFLVVGGLSKEYYLEPEFKYDSTFYPLVVRLIHHQQMSEEISEFMIEFIERLFAYLSFILQPLVRNKGKTEDIDKQQDKSLFSTYETYEWYANKLIEYDINALLKIKEIIKVIDYPSYVISKLLELSDMNLVLELIRAISTLNIILPARFEHYRYSNLSFDLILQVALEHPLLLYKLTKLLKGFRDIAFNNFPNITEFLEKVYEMMKDLEKIIDIPELRKIILSKLYGKFLNFKDYAATIRILSRLLGIPIRDIAKYTYSRMKTVILLLELYIANKTDLINNNIKRKILDDVIEELKIMESKPQSINRISLEITRKYPDFFKGIIESLNSINLTADKYLLLLKVLYSSNPKDFINTIGDPCKTIRNNYIMDSLAELVYNRILEYLLDYESILITDFGFLNELSKCSEKAREYLEILVDKIMINEKLASEVLYLLKEGYASNIVCKYKEKLLKYLKDSCYYLEALFLLNEIDKNLIREVIDANIEKCESHYIKFIEQILKKKEKLNPELIEYLKEVKSMLLVFSRPIHISLEL